MPHALALGPDVAVLQECACPEAESGALRWAGDNPKQGIAVLAGEGWSVEPIEVDEVPRWMVPFRVSGPRAFTLLAVWTLPTGSYSKALFDALERFRDLLSAGPAVVMGDFNTTSLLDRPGSAHGHGRIVGLLGEMGLESAYHAFHAEAPGAESRATYYHQWRREQPYHIDYCFVPREWLPGITGVRVGGYEEWAGRSDHRPLVVDVDLEDGIEGGRDAIRDRETGEDVAAGRPDRLAEQADPRIGRTRPP